MPGAPVFIAIDGTQRLKKLSRELKAAGRGDLRREMRKEIREAGKPVVEDVRRAVMAVDVTSSRGGTAPPDTSTGLRARVARATGLSITANGIRIRVSGRRMGGDARLAKYLDASLGSYARWRHPVFGNRDVWVEQRGEPYFFNTIRNHTRDFRKAIDDAMAKTAAKIRS